MVTSRDREIVELLDRAGGMDVPALRCAMGLTQTVMYRRLGRLEEHGMVHPVRPFSGAHALYVPTRLGMRELIAKDLEPPSVSAFGYNHQVQVGRVIAQLQRCGVRWESCRVTRRNQHAARAAGDSRGARRYALTLAMTRRSHLPDVLVWPSRTAEVTEQPVAIEVELTLKTRRRIDEILSGYATHLGMAGVVYVCSTATHAAISDAVKRGRRERVVLVTRLDEFGPSLDAGPDAQGGWVSRYLVDRELSELERALRARDGAIPALTLPGI